MTMQAAPARFNSVFPRSKLVTMVSVAPLIAFTTLIIMFLADRAWTQADLTAFAAFGLLAGLPHGAVDLFLELGPNGVPHGRALAWQLLLYVLVVAAALAVILLYPVFGVGLFIAVSAWHFGSSESAFNACRRARLPRLAPIEAIAYGAPLTVVPFICWPAQVGEIIDPLGGAGVTNALVGPAAIAIAIAIAAAAVTIARKALRRHWLDIGELLLLWTATVVLPPLAAFSVYFALWHSPRHVIRTLPELPANRRDLTSGRLVRCVLRYGLYTLPGTVGALAIFAVLVVVNNGAAFADLQAATWVGAFLAALTMPHTMAILRYDLWLSRKREA